MYFNYLKQIKSEAINANEIKLDIEERISEIEDTFPDFWRKSFYERLLTNDINSLEKTLKRIKLELKSLYIFILVISVALIVILFKKYMDGVECESIYRLGLFFLSISGVIRGAFIQYKLKSNLENKIYLLKLLDKIDRE